MRISYIEYTAVKAENNAAEVRTDVDLALLMLVSLVKARDNETASHLVRTAQYVRLLAEHLRNHPRFAQTLCDETIELLVKSAPLHDIGKVGIPDRVLLKPGRLTPDEFAVMRTHAKLGYDVLAQAEAQLGHPLPCLAFAKEIALSHHEKWDGSGYPQGLAGDAIPMSARLMAVADVYDALTSRRSYKPAMSHEEALQIMRQGRGRHFDPDVLDAFLVLEQQFAAIAARHGDTVGDLTALAQRVLHG
ncbi:HD-GYP domain-containing protein [Pseudoduganella sp. R-43]|uniref:HD-GYP domain-containing protein n=1 Tax=Pseudoduganella sp. R-43 TaxID=3404063 RepID=UPI003CF6984E